MYFRLYNYQGGAYTFSDGSSTIHTDYFSGWDEAELQKALDGCSKDPENGSNSAQPDKWCEKVRRSGFGRGAGVMCSFECV